MIASRRWQDLAAAGANAQRPLWASTGVKNPAYPDTMYVTELVAPGTVNTMPQATLEAVADHGQVRGDTVTGTYQQARHVLQELEQLGIGYTEVVDQLEAQGIEKFTDAYTACRTASTPPPPRPSQPSEQSAHCCARVALSAPIHEGWPVGGEPGPGWLTLGLEALARGRGWSRAHSRLVVADLLGGVLDELCGQAGLGGASAPPGVGLAGAQQGGEVGTAQPL
ncbi:transaldolase family protein, partial [Segeticoccus rhizosphaerae]|uniref:transaldolase family protein n=1 Tax=Segeticoccus rhizosphaerae TaxID=1104777 RepID=UPI0030843803